MTNEQLIEEIFAAPRRNLVRLPDTEIIEREGWWQIITPSLRHGGMNEIGFAVLAESEADGVIARTLAQYRELGLQFRWTLPPGSRPADLADRLARHGMLRSDGRGMWRSTSGFPPGAASGIEVEQITPATVDEYTRVMAEGWEMDPGPLDVVHRTMLALPDGRVPLFLARAGGVPAGVAGVALLPRSAYLMGAVVLPPFRGRGIYRALISARLAAAAARGLAIATTQARESTSAPRLERLGFETACRHAVFVSKPNESG